MADTTFPGATASHIAAAVNARTASAVDVARAHLARIHASNDEFGAFQHVRRETALAEAEQVDGMIAHGAALPLAGVPIAIKDNVAVAGVPMLIGSRASSDAPSTADHEVVSRLRAAGAVIMGTTRVPELCLWGSCDSAFGVTRSPWNLQATAGGSSGGSAAAVAAAMVPVAHGNDGLGSIRIPAACCGLVGIKPGPGVVPAGLGSTSWFGIAENGALATTVADAALVLSVIAGMPALRNVREPTRSLRIALAIEPPAAGIRVDGERAAVTREVAAALAHAGHVVTEVKPPTPSPLTVLGILGSWGAGARDEIEVMLADDPLAWARLERRTRAHARMGDVARRLGLASERHRVAWRARMDEFFRHHDVLMTPTLARAPLAADGWRNRGWLANLVANMVYAPYCGPVNFARLPAIAVPAGAHSDGNAASVHFVGPASAEALLLGIASQIECLRPWQRHAPRVAAAIELGAAI